MCKDLKATCAITAESIWKFTIGKWCCIKSKTWKTNISAISILMSQNHILLLLVKYKISLIQSANLWNMFVQSTRTLYPSLKPTYPCTKLWVKKCLPMQAETFCWSRLLLQLVQEASLVLGLTLGQTLLVIIVECRSLNTHRQRGHGHHEHVSGECKNH